MLKITLIRNKTVNAVVDAHTKNNKGDDMYFDCGYDRCDHKRIVDQYFVHAIMM